MPTDHIHNRGRIGGRAGRRVCCVTALLFVGLVVYSAGGATPKRVLLLHSYGREFAPFNTFSESFRTELAQQSGEPVEFHDVALESARFDDGAPEGPLVDYLVALFARHRLDLVVPIGGPAVRFAQEHRQQLFPGTPMLIAATDERHLRQALLTTNDVVAAVVNEPGMVIQNMLRVLPETTNVVVVIGNSPLEKFWLGEIRGLFQPFTNRVNFVWFNALSFGDMQKRVATLPPRSAIFYPLLSVDVEGVPHVEEQALVGLRAVANAPIFGLHDSQLGRGIVGGPLMAIEALSRNTAGAGVRILRGEPPASIKVPTQSAGTPIYDWRELRRWGISERRLPPDSIIRFREPTTWESYKAWIIGGISLCLVEAILIVHLVANLRKRQRAERSFRESEERLSLATAAADIGVWVWDVSGNQIWASPNWRRMFGFAVDETIGFAAVIQRIHEADRANVLRALLRAVEGKADYVGEYRVALPDGTQRWIVARGRLDSASKGKQARMVGASMDITDRKRTEKTMSELSGRFLRAQEAERARMARELHDDVTQRLARLAIDASRVERQVPDSPAADTMREVREGLVRLSEDVHALSYRLHPSVLEDLGLAEALKAECDRFTRQESIRTELKLREIPACVSPEIGLCLFRVAQEALRNAGRHSKADKVDILLHGMDGGLQLAVRDNGAGFDQTRHRDRRSLGLASMQERVRLLRGEIEIDTSPGQGTAIVAWVPLQKALP